MRSGARTILEWTYDPKDFFEEELVLQYEGGEITVAQGRARGEFGSEHYDRGVVFRDEAHDYLSNFFLIHQVLTHSLFCLTFASMAREHTDGRHDTTLFLEGGQFTLSGGSADFIVRDAEGNIVADSKAELLSKQAAFRAEVARLLPNDPVLKRMLNSYTKALKDHGNFLVHLYEIRDALVAMYGGEREAKTATGISTSEWSDFGRMANNMPLLEGRHRGSKEGLRPATADEVHRATSFARRLIEGYVRTRNHRN